VLLKASPVDALQQAGTLTSTANAPMRTGSEF